MNKYKSLITKPEELVVGNTYFVVHKFYNESWVTNTKVNSEPKIGKHSGYLYIDIDSYNELVNSFISDMLFLNDFNIPENTYNNHRIFSNEKEAIDYANS